LKTRFFNQYCSISLAKFEPGRGCGKIELDRLP
jgi:hypothetical protein